MEMKQKITVKQLDELSAEQLHKLLRWQLAKGYIKTNKHRQVRVKRLSIGELIEFLRYHNHAWDANINNYVVDVRAIWSDNCCDDLWRAVKEVLQNERHI